MIQEKIVEFLKKADGYLSGEEISESLKISRSAIWKYIQELRENGYEIVAVPHLGYRLDSLPDKLFPSEIQFNLHTKVLGKKIVHYDTVSSTMDTAFALAAQGAPEGTVVCAEGQSKGRGRLGRSWASPKGKGVYMSVILRPSFLPSDVAKLTLLSGVALCEAIKNLTGLQTSIKWPNDILIHGKKIAGILTELDAEMERVKFVVIGIGLNVNAKSDSLPEHAASLRSELKKSVSRVDMAREILREMEKWYVLLQNKGFSPVAKRWKELSVTLNKRVKISDPAGMLEGDAVDIDQDGGLLIRKDSGVLVKRMAGDITQVRL